MQQTAGKPDAAPDLRQRGLNYRQKDALWGYGMITIPLIGMLIFILIPFGMSVYASFTSWPMGQAIEKAKTVGLKNYIDMFNNKLFWQSLGNTFFYMIGIPIGLAISLLLAAAMNRGLCTMFPLFPAWWPSRLCSSRYSILTWASSTKVCAGLGSPIPPTG